MRRKQHAPIANRARRRRLWHANQSRDVRKSAGPPARQLRAEATIPFARVELEIAHALPAMRARQFRDRDNQAASKFQQVIFAAGQELAATKRLPSARRFPWKLQISVNAEVWVAHASRVSGERVSRSRTFPLRPTRLCDSRSKESLFRRDAETRHAGRVRYPGVNRTIQLFDGDDA